MAASLDGRVLSLPAADDTYTGEGVIDFIMWSGGTTAAHVANLEDNTTGKTIWKASITAAGETVVSPKFENGLRFNGLKIEDLGSGVVYVYLR